MKTFKLTRKNMADLLLSLNGTTSRTPHQALYDVWGDLHKDELPPILQKILKPAKGEVGFSLKEIVSLGNLIEFTNFPQSTVQNWVKRDVRGLIGSPQLGKKYTTEQAAMLFIVEDLKATLDFGSIRKVLTLVFNNIEDRTDDIVNPTDLYLAYASVFDQIHHRSLPSIKTADGSVNEHIDDFIKEECRVMLETFDGIAEDNLSKVLNVMIVSVLTVQAGFYQAVTKKYVMDALA
ncbi:DUF1836 domain-containing protein [Rossellomorea vietnamensis]|uniref:DUF1836 domain-containing protein n=1 Tax=Rossellomorea vietnamensis TaxID=218284 RepID=A0A0P6W5Z3_9BACI|nr:DUF1836 domain-containing protein [Rossellomorea vietnamensis]KPL60341.1 hypothetical protein AM506_06960 [Rossellomorea vietnamensis]